jgi:pyruvate formate lyase activating enzyme
MKEALLYEKLADKKVKCGLCNHYCLIDEAKRGICAVRENREGILYSLVYGLVIAKHVDPIEKKPFFHLHPGSRSFSVATTGCNFRCLNCQNSDISQLPREDNRITGIKVTPEEVVAEAVENDCQSISYTYTEPTIFFEYAYDIARLAREKGIKNNFVTNGYMSDKSLEMIAPYLDAANVDVKGFSEEFYRKICGAKLSPVLDNLKLMKKLGIWVEITTLVIPGLNDNDRELEKIAGFIAQLGKETPWHVSAFHPDYKLADKPMTPPEMLGKARRIGLTAGLRYVYSGNVPGDQGENTYCYNCHNLIISRYGFEVTGYKVTNSCCNFCGIKIDGIGI